MFEIKNVSKQYHGQSALNQISLTLGKGLNFIVGASGSGKTTLLKILSGMDSDFEGSVLFNGNDIGNLNNQEKSYLYNNVFGFIFQEFNLLDDLTVKENIVLPSYLKSKTDMKEVNRILKSLKIFNIVNKKIKNLSGGQKQRVAIARELIKNPQVIFADEPTSALDKHTAKEIMSILRTLSKTKTVIIVTHDTSLIMENDHVLELDKGELLTTDNVPIESDTATSFKDVSRLSFKHSYCLAKINMKRHMGRMSIFIITLMLTSILLLTTFSGTIKAKSQKSFDKLFDTYGESLLDVSIVGSFMSAAGVDNKENNQPSGDVTQDIKGLYEKYVDDERVQFALFSQAFDDITINIEGKQQKIESSGNAPVFNKLLSGKMPEGMTHEVVVPNQFVKKAGFTEEGILGKEIEFFSSVYSWDTGEPVLKKVRIKAVVVGVADNTMVYEYEGKTNEYSIDDSFFFNKTALDDIRNQAGFKDDKLNFQIRAKTPADMISLKDELNKKGIVPLGQFELVEDMVRLNQQSNNQSGLASKVIALIAIVMTVAVFSIANIMRKREFSIYKLTGYNNKHLVQYIFTEIGLLVISTILLLIFTSPVLTIVTKALFQVEILSVKMLLLGVGLIISTAFIAGLITVMTALKTNPVIILKSGER